MSDFTSFIRSSMPFCATLDIRAVDDDPSAVVLAVDHDDSLCTVNGMLHGGLIMTLADSAGAVCAFLNLPEGASGTSTVESKTNFLGAVGSGEVRATARLLHVGGTTIVVETEVTNGDRLVAKTTQTQLVRTS